jgi:aspartate kinase
MRWGKCKKTTMIIQKFGGTSVGSPQRMMEVARIIDDRQPKIVVLSAVAGTTNKLLEYGRRLSSQHWAEAGELLASLREEYENFVYQLLPDNTARRRAQEALRQCFGTLEAAANSNCDAFVEKEILAQGELLSTHLFQIYLESQSLPAVLLPALEFMRLDENEEPDLEYIEANLEAMLEAQPKARYFLTQGYICRNAKGRIDNLKRGGSDYTATLVGAALMAEEIQIWTDVDGLHTNDPRVAPGARPVRRVSYREAAELAYFGAKILHPTCVLPAERRRIPIRLKNTFVPDAEGTLISSTGSGAPVTAIAAKDGITAIKIRSSRMLNAYGFLRRVFEVFEHYRTPIDMITTSEVAVSLTIDDKTHLEEIMSELSAFCEVSRDHDQTIICIVGDKLYEQRGMAKRIFSALSDIPIRMVSYGGSVNNLSILVHGDYKMEALNTLDRALFHEWQAALSG